MLAFNAGSGILDMPLGQPVTRPTARIVNGNPPVGRLHIIDELVYLNISGSVYLKGL